MKILYIFLFFIPMVLYAHGATALIVAINFILISFVVLIFKLFYLKIFENISIKKLLSKFLLLFVLEVLILNILYSGFSNALIWDIIKVTLYLFLPIGIIINYIFLISIINYRIKSIIYAIIFVLLSIIISWKFTISKFKCSESYGLYKCNFFKLPPLDKIEFFDN